MRQALIILWLLLFVASSLAQEKGAKNNQPSKPNFTGTWKIDPARTKATKEGLIARGGTVTLLITHNEPEIRVTEESRIKDKERAREYVYYTDGRGESNVETKLYEIYYEGDAAGIPSPAKTESVSRWKGSKLITMSSIIVHISTGRQSKVIVNEEWELSSDGQTLARTTRYSSNDSSLETDIQPNKLKKVYTKIS